MGTSLQVVSLYGPLFVERPRWVAKTTGFLRVTRSALETLSGRDISMRDPCNQVANIQMPVLNGMAFQSQAMKVVDEQCHGITAQ